MSITFSFDHIFSILCRSRAESGTGSYYFVSDDINPNQFYWGIRDSFGGVKVIENINLLATVLGDNPSSLVQPGQNLVSPELFDFGGGSCLLQPFVYTVSGNNKKLGLPIGSALQNFLSNPLQGAAFDLTLPFLDPHVALSDSSALLRIQRNPDGSIKMDNDAGVWHTAIDFDYSGNTSQEFDVVAPADGIVEGNSGGQSLAIRHQASNGEEFLSLYGHLLPSSKSHLPPGTPVLRGQSIGRIQRNADNYAHLHFAIAVRGPSNTVNGTVVPELWYLIDPFGVNDYRRNLNSLTDYNYLPNNRLDLPVKGINKAYVFRTNPLLGSLLPGPCGSSIITLPFTDLLSSNTFFCTIGEAYFSGLTNGTDATHYSPSANVTRDQMSAFITRTLDQAVKRSSPRIALRQTSNTQTPANLQTITVGTFPNYVESGRRGMNTGTVNRDD